MESHTCKERKDGAPGRAQVMTTGHKRESRRKSGRTQKGRPKIRGHPAKKPVNVPSVPRFPSLGFRGPSKRHDPTPSVASPKATKSSQAEPRHDGPSDSDPPEPQQGRKCSIERP